MKVISMEVISLERHTKLLVASAKRINAAKDVEIELECIEHNLKLLAEQNKELEENEVFKTIMGQVLCAQFGLIDATTVAKV